MPAFLIALAGVFGLVAVRRATDRGMRERRALLPLYPELFEAFAEFERAGGRAHDLEWEGSAHTSSGFRRQLGRVWFGSYAMTVALTLAWYLIGWPLWVWLVLVAAHQFATAFFVEMYLEVVGGSTAGSRGAREVTFVAIGSAARAAVVLLAVTMLWNSAELCGSGDWLLGSVLAIGSVAVADVAHVPARWAESAGRRRERVEFGSGAAGDTVLYLRSFNDDRRRIYSLASAVGYTYRLNPGRNRIEEIISSLYAGNSTNLVCIGRPGERAPSLGAGRTYWTDDSWQRAVQLTAARASATVLLAGSTQGLAWEVAQLRSMDLLGKLIVLLPADGEEGSWDRYRTIVDQLNVPEHQRLRDAVQVMAVPALCFTDDGEPIHLIAAGRNWLTYMLAILRFQWALTGSSRLDEAGSFSTVVDPVNLVQFGMRTKGREVVYEMVLNLDDSARLRLALAWLALADRRDPDGAREFIDRGLHDYPGDDDLLFASHTLEQQGPTVDPDAILGESKRAPDPPTRPRVETIRAPRSLWRWPGVYAKAETALEDGDLDNAWALAERGLAIARSAGVPTAEAMSDVLRIKVMIRRGELDKAATAADAILVRSDLTDVTLGPTVKIEKWDVQDDALLAQVEVASRRGPAIEQIRAIERLRDHRVLWGRRELAADAAMDVAAVHLDRDRSDEVERWARMAEEEYRTLGRASDRVRAMVLVGRALIARRKWSDAVAVASEACVIAEDVGEPDAIHDAQLCRRLAAEGLARASARPEDSQTAADAHRRSAGRVAHNRGDEHA